MAAMEKCKEDLRRVAKEKLNLEKQRKKQLGRVGDSKGFERGPC